jgi:hypothetical protein
MKYQVGQVYYYSNNSYEILFEITKLDDRVRFKTVSENTYKFGFQEFAYTSKMDLYCRHATELDKARFL